MTAKDSKYLLEFDKALKGWTDERFVSRQALRDLALLYEYIVNLADEDGWEYCGHSLQVKGPTATLVVRAKLEGIPHIVFSSGRTATGCVRAFMRKMEEGWLEWQVDRYRT